MTTDVVSAAGALVGSWLGTYHVWLGPGDPARLSSTRATVTQAAGGAFLVITYAWSESERPHDGVLMLRLAAETGPVDMVWVDSFHTMGEFMRFVGSRTQEGGREGTTTWSIGDGPDWGWRIVVSTPTADELLVQMYVATPAGEESPAVEQRYTRAPQRTT